MISDRKKKILQAIISEYFETAQPVSSSIIANKYKLDISSATVRNEMMELEEEGYILQPHTSSGRVPTQLAYKLIKDDLFNNKRNSLKKKDLESLEKIFNYDNDSLKKVAKQIAELSGVAVFWAFHKNDLYYTGLSNLFSQPEFQEVEAVHDFSEIIDRMEEIIDDIFDDLDFGEQISIGSSNPFGAFLSSVILKYKKNNQTGLVGIIGPMRMDYQYSLELIKYIKNKFK